MERDIDCDYTKEITCPYCGWEDSDSWERGIDESESEETCGRCEKTFMCTANVSVTYSTTRIPCEDDKHHYGVVEKRETTADDVARYKRENSVLAKYVLEPKTTYVRHCVDCEEFEHREVKPGEDCPADLLALPSFVEEEAEA